MSDSKYAVDVSSLADEEKRGALNYMARLAESAERYDDMAELMKQLVIFTDSKSVDLTDEERNLLSVAYKNVIGSRRSSWRTVTEPIEDSKYTALVNGFKVQIENELERICSEILGLLENQLVANADRNGAGDEAKVFYIKMLGDYYRYRAESAAASSGYDAKSAENYGKAFALAKGSLPPTHPTRLGLALNYSVCFYEILKEPQKACELAKEAFDLAISKLDELRDEEYKDSTLIMQLLRDNLTLWMSDNNNQDDDNDGGDLTVTDMN